VAVEWEVVELVKMVLVEEVVLLKEHKVQNITAVKVEMV
jgi:hypothetical protein